MVVNNNNTNYNNNNNSNANSAKPSADVTNVFETMKSLLHDMEQRCKELESIKEMMAGNVAKVGNKVILDVGKL